MFNEFLKRNWKLTLIIITVIIATIFLDVIAKFLKLIPYSSILNLTSIGDRILFITFLCLVWYAWETRKIREIEQDPILLMYIRNINNYNENKRKQLEDYVIKSRRGELSNLMGLDIADDYLIRLRNVGRGAAFNVKVEIKSKNFKIEKYQTQFFSPESDEQSIEVVVVGDKPWGVEELNGEIFHITCESINKKVCIFKYKIVDLERMLVEFVK